METIKSTIKTPHTHKKFVICYFLLFVFLFFSNSVLSYAYTEADLKAALVEGQGAQKRGDYGNAVSSYERAVTISNQLFGEFHSATAVSLNNLGSAYSQKGDYDRAISFHEKALTIYLRKSGNDHPDAANCYIHLGEAYSNKGDHDRAIGYYEKALPIYLKKLGNDHPNVATCYNNIGEAYRYKGDYDRAIGYYEKALAIYLRKFGKDHIYVAACYNNLGLAYLHKGEYDRAIMYCEKAIKILVDTLGENHPDVASGYNSIGGTYGQKAEYGNAIKYLEKALAIRLRTLGEAHPYVAESYHRLGEAYRNNGNYDRAIIYHEKALAIFLRTFSDSHPHAATCYYGIGWAYADKGDYDRAIGYYENALAVWLKSSGEKHVNVALSYNNLGEAYRNKGDYVRAIGYYEKALHIYSQVLGENHLYVATSYNNLGLAYNQKGDLDKAVSNYKKAFDIERKILGEDHPVLATILSNIGLMFSEAGEPAQAIGFLNKALAINLKAHGNTHPSVALNYNNIGFEYKSQGDYDQAISFYRKSITIFKKYGVLQETIVASMNLGLTYFDKGDNEEAKAAFEEAIGVIEQARTDMGGGKQEFMARNIHSYLYSLKASARMGDQSGVFATAERMRARGFLDRLSLQAALAVEEVGPQDREQMLKLNDETAYLSAMRNGEIQKPEGKQDKNMILQVSKELEDKEKAFNALDENLMKKERYRNLRRPAILSLRDAVNLAGKHTAILEYIIWEENNPKGKSIRDKQSYCLVITSGKTTIVELDRNFNYSQAIGGYREAIIGQKKEAQQLGALLYEKLIAPVEKQLYGIKKIVIVPDGTLTFLPFDALRKDTSSPYLCERYTVTLSPSVSIMAMVRNRKYDNGRKPLLAFGSAVYSDREGMSRSKRAGVAARGVTIKEKEYLAKKTVTEGGAGYYAGMGLIWENIPGTLDEVEAIGRVFGKRGSTIIKGMDTSERRIKALSKTNELNQYKIVHFATHGYYDQDYPSFSAVVLSEVSGKLKDQSPEDGYLSVEETALLKLSADMVNLSACETGLGKIVNGDGVVGLTRAFQVAGANRVGVTLWQVADDATRDFMMGVYGKVKKGGKSFGTAINEMKREFIRSKSYRNPYFWSPFVLYGD